MKAIYLDNFRGFQDSLINLKEVNFLVGENSAGKSSFLSIYEKLSNKKFLFNMNFSQDNNNSDFINFDDVISAESNQKNSFTIGNFELNNESNNLFPKKIKGNQILKGFIISYNKDNNKSTFSIMPDRITYIQEGRGFIVKITEASITYKIYELDFNDDLNSIYSNVINNHKNLNEGFKKITPELDGMRNIPFTIIMDLINSQNNYKHELSLNSLLSYSPPVIWIAPIREKPKRIYENVKQDFTPEGTHTPQVLNDILNNIDDSKRGKFVAALKEFGEESGLFSDISSNRFAENDASPFEINVTLHKAPIKITNVGYGVSQVLPIIVEAFRKIEKSIFCIQQPEVHLHPKAQAALGRFFFKLASLENKGFLIETHSDFLIDRYRYSLAKEENSKPSSQVMYFERVDGFNKVTPIEIESNGKYSESQPDSFREFFLNEQLSLLEI